MVFFGAKDRNHSTLLLATKHTKMEFFGAKDKTREYPLSVQFSEEGIRLMHPSRDLPKLVIPPFQRRSSERDDR